MRHIENLAETDGRYGDESHVKTVEPMVLPIGQVLISQRTEDMDGKQTEEDDVKQPSEMTCVVSAGKHLNLVTIKVILVLQQNGLFTRIKISLNRRRLIQWCFEE